MNRPRFRPAPTKGAKRAALPAKKRVTDRQKARSATDNWLASIAAWKPEGEG